MQFQPPSQPGWGQQEPGQYPQQPLQQPRWQQAPDGRWYQVQPQAQVQPYYSPQQMQQQPGYLYPQQQPYYQQHPYYYPPQQYYQPQIMVAVNQSVNVGNSRIQQYPFLWRLLYFLFIGWWAALAWLSFALMFFVTILGIPVGVIMLNYLPAVMTLQKH